MYTVLVNGLICDGSGSEPEAKELLLKNGRIADFAAPGTFAGVDAEKIDAAGKIIAPGFIDVHAHGDTRKLKFPERKSVLLQGVTTEVDGNCGTSASCVPGEYGNLTWQNLDQYAKIINELQIPVNTVALAGHNSIRRQVMGNSPEKATPEEIKAMQQLLDTLELEFRDEDGVQHLYCNGTDVTEAIRTPEISANVSAVSMIPAVRDSMTAQQRRIAEGHDVLMDGRDIGTTVLPNAQYKFFLTASLAERARRRGLELEQKGQIVDYAQLERDIALRDEKDSKREVSPLKMAEDAELIDTSDLSFDEVVDLLYHKIIK